MSNMCSKGGGLALAPPAPYNQPAAPPPTLPCANLAQGVAGKTVADHVKACGAAAMNKSSTVEPTQDIGPMGIGGTISGKLAGAMEFANCTSSKVKIEGAAAARMGDTTKHDSANCPAGTWQAPSALTVMVNG